MKFIRIKNITVLFLFSLISISCSPPEIPKCEILIKNGVIYDGSGNKSYNGIVAIKSDKIVYVGPSRQFEADSIIDVNGMAIAPGFINMLSWGYNSLLDDGRGLSDLIQGVTLEVFGEGSSPGPRGSKSNNTYISFKDAMEKLEKKGVSSNIASYLGAASVRIQVMGYKNKRANHEELKKMGEIVEEAMKDGAIGIGSSLIYAPGDYADTDELIALCRVAAKYDGRYISHMRNEDNQIIAALDEFMKIAKGANIPAEIYHLKASRKANWHLLDSVINRVERARAEGYKITADMYTYRASSTGLTGVIPTWVQEGGHRAWINRMKKPEIRERLFKDIRKELDQQPPEGILMVGFNKASMSRKYLGKTVAEAARIRNQSPEEAIVDMIIEDDNRIQCIYFSMSEENIRKKIQIPWVSFCSDAGSYSDISKKFRTHPRAFGSFARVIGKYSRDEGLISLEEAVRRLSGFPAENLGILNRGLLKKGYFADIVIFDPQKVQDHATFDEPLQYSSGVVHVFVNGEQVIKNGNHLGVFPGRFIKGSGAKKILKDEFKN
ncbi:MAG: aminoacylase [Flavobacteriaceae bacterium]|nr:aminoacylase [Flavobacteriaceae bacterium]|tara:strand:- start:5269 stop:6921 length:1653 start_codon:yes stop_codon:yes gene_type:complete